MIAAANGAIVTFDNLSGISAALSDAICSLATGSGFGTSELYSDGDEKLFDEQRPVMINGIDELSNRPDPMDRAVHLTLPMVPDENRRTEHELWEEFERIWPRILGALLEVVSGGLRNERLVTLMYPLRMADFAVWVTAAEPAHNLGTRDVHFGVRGQSQNGE